MASSRRAASRLRTTPFRKRICGSFGLAGEEVVGPRQGFACLARRRRRRVDVVELVGARGAPWRRAAGQRRARRSSGGNRSIGGKWCAMRGMTRWDDSAAMNGEAAAILIPLYVCRRRESPRRRAAGSGPAACRPSPAASPRPSDAARHHRSNEPAHLQHAVARARDFSPLEPGHVRMYVCGMTVYDLCHVGHARMMMAFDVVRRWLRRHRLARHLRAQHHRHRRQDHPARASRATMPIRALTDG